MPDVKTGAKYMLVSSAIAAVWCMLQYDVCCCMMYAAV